MALQIDGAMVMIQAIERGDNTPQLVVSATRATTTTFVTMPGGPPPVLIGLIEVSQMRRKKQMIAALAEWEARRTASLLPMGNIPGQSAGMTSGGCGR